MEKKRWLQLNLVTLQILKKSFPSTSDFVMRTHPELARFFKMYQCFFEYFSVTTFEHTLATYLVPY